MNSNQNSTTPWVEKYRPKFSKQLIGFENITNKLRKFIEDFFILQKKMRGIKKQFKNSSDPLEKKKFKIQLRSTIKKLKDNTARLLIGPPGVGKTTIVYAIANDYSMSVIELNASDARTEEALKNKLQETVKSTNLLSFTNSKVINKLILVDEVDGIHGQSDRGGVSTLEKIIESSKYPIIMTCNFRDDKKFKGLYALASPLIEVPSPTITSIKSLITQIVSLEKIKILPEQIDIIAKHSNGDYRSAINDLQALSQGTKFIDSSILDNINMKRDSKANLQDLMDNLFKSDSIKKAKYVIDDVLGKDADFRTINKWINENILNYLKKREDIRFAFENLAQADQILGYIGRTQDYGHLSYFFDILAGGTKFSKSDKLVPLKKIRPPRWFRLRATPDDEIALALQKLYRISLNEIMRNIRPNLPIFLQYQPDISHYFSSLLNIPEKKVLMKFKNK